MSERLGYVLYWFACIVALAWAALAYYGISTMKPPDWSMFAIAGILPAMIVWGIGRAVRYVLSGR